MPAIDTDALVALHSSRHPHHLAACQLFDRATQVLLHPSVVTEFTTVMRREANRAGQDGNRIARDSLKALLEQPRVRISLAVDHEAAVRRYLGQAKLSFTDAVVAGFGQDPISFDSDLVKASKKPV